MTIILDTNKLTKLYGKQKAVDNVSITIKQGDIYGLIGRNGAGKTTLMRIISGLAKPSSGGYKVFGESTDDTSLTRIGCLIENTGIYPNLTAFEHLYLKKIAVGIKEQGIENKLLDLVGLADTGKKKVKQFSLGMKQRLGIALALIGYPDLVILDEPINGLDPQGIVEIRNIIEKLNQEEGITFIISSHILDELAKTATRFGIIDRGQLLEEIDRDLLLKKSSDRIELRTSEATTVLPLLDHIGIKDYKLISDNLIYIYDSIERTGEISLILAQHNVPIETLNIHKNTLEDYYLHLTGYAQMRNKGGE